ncbi:unnamed protein product [Danaus chrysippus]|uniref:(African queen) hypothetical protein n=1 Tax=Danaus chrysippus TaxID=151541 RepID=A0A8J2QP63_9NEOP|nr:unnamed protein product [Danaus chrysippus]
MRAGKQMVGGVAGRVVRCTGAGSPAAGSAGYAENVLDEAVNASCGYNKLKPWCRRREQRSAFHYHTYRLVVDVADLQLSDHIVSKLRNICTINNTSL